MNTRVPQQHVWPVRVAALIGLTGLFGTTGLTSAATIEWRNLAIGTSGSPASWFQNSNWGASHLSPTPASVPTALDDVTFGGTLASNALTEVQFFDGDPAVGYPNAFAKSLVADSATSPDPSLSSLRLRAGDLAGSFAGTLRVQGGAFDLGTQYQSTVDIESDRWGVFHEAAPGSPGVPLTSPLRVARNGATASLTIRKASLFAGFDLEIGNGFDASTTANVQSTGVVSVQGTSAASASIAVGRHVSVGLAGGFGQFLPDTYTNTTIDGRLTVGTGAPASPNGRSQSRGELIMSSGFDTGSTLAIAKELLVGVDSAVGTAGFVGQVTIGTEANPAFFIIGRNAVDDVVQNVVNRADGSATFTGESTTWGNGFVGIDGGAGSIGWAFGGHAINGNLTVGDLGFTSTIDGYVPSTGSAGLALNTTVTINGDLFIGNNKSFGTFNASTNGDGGASVSARYVSVGELGTGELIVAGMTSATFNHLEIKLASGTELYEQGGNVRLGSGSDESARLSVSRLSARGEGNRFEWNSATLVLRDGVINDWGAADLTVPEQGTLEGAGTVDVVALRNRGTLRVGYYEANPTYDDSLTVTGAFANDNGTILLEASRPNRFGNFDETLIINGDATFNGGSIELVITDVIGSGYDWYTDIQIGDTFNFFDFGSTVSLSSPTVNLPFLPAGYTWNTSQLWTNGVIIVNAVPEPSCLAALALTGMVALRRRGDVR